MKRILSIILTACLVAVAFVGLRFYTFDKVLPNAHFGMRAICHTDDISDLYIGSSAFRQAIDAQRLNENAFLLAYNSNMPCLEALQVKYLIENGAKFDRLVVDMYPFSLVSEAGLYDTRMLMDGDLHFISDIHSTLHNNSRSSASLYDMLVLQNNEFFATLPVSYPLINARNERGSKTTINHGKDMVHRQIIDILQADEDSRPEKTIPLKDCQIAGLDEMIALCRARDNDILFLETPKYCLLYEINIYNHLMADYAKLLSERAIPMIVSKKTREMLSGTEIDDSLVQTYDFDDDNNIYFSDEIHLSYEGRQAFLKELKQLMDR